MGYICGILAIFNMFCILTVVSFGVKPAASGGAVAGSSFRADAGFEVEPDVLTGLSSSVRCSKSRLSFTKSEALYTWEVDGWLSYVKYLKDFGTTEFKHTSGTIVFDSDKINGEWVFELRSSGQENFISATYTYTENPDNVNGNFGIKLKIFQPNFESIQLPIQKSTETLRDKTILRKETTRKKQSSSTFMFGYTDSSEEEDDTQSHHESIETVTVKFQWPSIPSQKFLEFQNENVELTFAFMIHAYFPKDPKILKKSTCALDHYENQYLLESSHQPAVRCTGDNIPFIKHANEMFLDTKFSDCVVRVEGMDIPAHGIILHHSSPKIAEYMANATKKGSEGHTIVAFDDLTVGYNATLEILRYIYTGRVTQLEQMAESLLVGATRLNIQDLRNICEDYLVAHTDLNNVIDRYALALSVGSSRLIRKAFAVVQANRASLVSHSEDFRKLSTKYPNLMFELFIS